MGFLGQILWTLVGLAVLPCLLYGIALLVVIHSLDGLFSGANDGLPTEPGEASSTDDAESSVFVWFLGVVFGQGVVWAWALWKLFRS